MTYCLTKSKLQAFVQCPKKLWLTQHAPEKTHLGDAMQMVLDRGNRFGEMARSTFPEGQWITPKDPVQAVRETTAMLAAIEQGAARRPLFEAAFAQDDTVIRVDVLLPDPQGAGWTLIEVKSGQLREKDGAFKLHLLQDIAIQAYVLMKNGVHLTGIELAGPRKSFVYRQAGDYNGLIERVDVTQALQSLVAKTSILIESAAQTLASSTVPEKSVGPQCTVPHTCEFLARCTGAQAAPGEDISVPVWTLGGTPIVKVVKGLLDAGIRDLAEAPDHLLTEPIHLKMRSVARGEVSQFVNPALVTHLRSQPWPRYFLDYEDITGSPYPLFIGTSSAGRMPFQFSVHEWPSPNEPIRHHEFLWDEVSDPRIPLGQALLKAIGRVEGGVYTWAGKSVEGPVTDKLAEKFSGKQKDALLWIARQCRDADLLPLFRQQLFLKGMQSWSVKSIAQNLLATNPYDGLRIRNGASAMQQYEQMIGAAPGADRETTRQNLLKYCAVDTQVLILIWSALTGEQVQFPSVSQH